ncbi:hypothetical protein BKP37_12850 [Anaerobacillus alkalilacustris]|uniref:Helix-turn-helix domain containing protein n=1 Tax=Anaerobacillus alkalilacustris TaxID=393763 RepID=A0A1S2LK48_9BACI|nr:hypothetical protein [Anaerobacillus alkalilacustris]OIJ12684.1 hypothetical protein BKP37_12850 [Anaerobacillus alkalilacustris]
MKRNNIIPFNPYIALSDVNMDWEHKDVEKFETLWKEGISLKEIARKLKRTHDEVGVIIMDRARKGKIKPRKNGIW